MKMKRMYTTFSWLASSFLTRQCCGLSPSLGIGLSTLGKGSSFATDLQMQVPKGVKPLMIPEVPFLTGRCVLVLYV